MHREWMNAGKSKAFRVRAEWLRAVLLCCLCPFFSPSRARTLLRSSMLLKESMKLHSAEQLEIKQEIEIDP